MGGGKGDGGVTVEFSPFFEFSSYILHFLICILSNILIYSSLYIVLVSVR